MLLADDEGALDSPPIKRTGYSVDRTAAPPATGASAALASAALPQKSPPLNPFTSTEFSANEGLSKLTEADQQQPASTAHDHSHDHSHDHHDHADQAHGNTDQHHHHHHHHHEARQVANFTAYCLMLALSVHNIFEGACCVHRRACVQTYSRSWPRYRRNDLS